MVIGSMPLDTWLSGALILAIAALIWNELSPGTWSALQRKLARAWPSRVKWTTFIPIIAGLVLAGLMRAWLISAYFIVMGVLITAYFIQRHRREQGRLPATQILQMVLSFRSMYQLQPSAFSTLDAVKDKVDEPLKSLVRVTVETFYLTSSPERAFGELRARSGNVYLNQFAYILAMTERARQDAVLKALDNLLERLRTHDTLRREVQSNLTAITGQTSFIQAISVLVILTVAAVPLLRNPYLTLGGQLFLILILSVMLLASYYIDFVIQRLTERIS